MPYKKDCGFRVKAKVCTFKPEECRVERCKFFELHYTEKDIKKRAKEEMKNLAEAEAMLSKLKKTDRKAYQEKKREMRQMFKGLYYLGKSMNQLKGITINKSYKKVANKIMKKLKDAKSSK